MHPNPRSSLRARSTNVSFFRLLSLLMVLTLAAPALAGDRALAEALFLEGKRLLDEKKFPEACLKFEASQRQDPSPGTLLNLGRCNEEQGKTATAWARYKEAATLAQNMSRPEQESAARERIDALEPKLSRLEIKPPPSAVDQLSVKRGGATMGADSLGIAAPVDPGKYDVEASAPGYETWKASVTVKPDGDSASIQIPELKKLPDAVVPPAPESKAPGEAKAEVVPDKPGGNKTLGYVLTGVGGAALITGGVFGFLAQKQAKDAKDDPNLCPNKVCTPKGRDEIDGAKSKALISTIGIGVGVAALGAGIYFIVSAPSAEKSARSTRPRFTPLLDPRAPGLSFSGAF